MDLNANVAVGSEHRHTLLKCAAAGALFATLYFVAQQDFLLFHTFAELFSVVVMFSIFTLCWNSRQFLDNNYLMFLGVACLFIGGVDTVHVLAYPGMGVFKGGSTNMSAQVWLAARYLQGASFLLAPLFLRRRLNLTAVFLGYGAAVALLLLAIFSWGIFPICFVDGVGLTAFKKGSEFLISALFALSVLLVLRKREAFDPQVVQLLAAALLAGIPAELAFTGYRDPFGTANTIGHFLKIVSFYLIYRAVVVTGIARPQQVLFRKLTQSGEALRASEERYRGLFNSMTEGFALHEIVTDESGQPCDYRFLEVNTAFERHTGLKAADIVGRTCLELFPQAEPVWFARYARVALTGEPAHFQGSLGPLGRWFEVSAYQTEPGRLAVLFFDITERKRAEEQMRRLAQFPEENPNPVLRVAVDGKLLYSNLPGRAMLAAMGATEENPLPEPLLTLVGQAAGSERSVEAEFADGQGRSWWAAAVRPAGEQHVNLYLRNITQRKRAEEALREANERLEFRVQERTVELNKSLESLRLQRQRFNDVLDVLPAYVVLLAPDYRVPFANRFFEGRFGKSEGRRCHEYLFHRSEPCENCETFRVLKTHAPHHWEWTGPDGRDYDISDFPFTDVDGSPLIMEVGLDVTERKAAEKALRDNMQRYRALTEQAPTFVLILQDGHVRYANPAAVQASGYTAEELRGKSMSELAQPEEQARAQELLARVMGGEPVEGIELRVVTRAGDPMWVRCSATRVDFEGQPAILVNALDVTQQRHLEQQLIQSAKLTAIGELISGVAHELNNPLAGVIGCAQLAQESGAQGELADYLERIVEQSRRASAIVNNLLVFARQREPQREPVSLSAVARNALDLRAYELRVSNVNVVTELEDGLPYVLGDSQQLVQVLLNLITNAEHAILSRGGTGTITIRTSTFSRDGGCWARLEVLDDGPGIPEPILGRIFEPFFTTKALGEGTGLGLSVSYGIVAAHQGFIQADNRPEGGARFVVDLPVAEGEERVTPVARSRTFAAAPARVLVIEDEPLVATVLARLLTGDGHDVKVAQEGGEALGLIEAEPFDLVITDFKMPGMSGLEFYRALAAAHPRLARRIIFTTGDVLATETRRFLAEVDAPMLYKPFTLEQARATIYDKLREVQG